MPAVLNAANEIAVSAFLDRRIFFNDIPAIIDKTMSAHKSVQADAIDTVFEADRWAREKAEKFIRDA